MKINNTRAAHLYDIVIFIHDIFFLYMSFGKFSYCTTPIVTMNVTYIFFFKYIFCHVVFVFPMHIITCSSEHVKIYFKLSRSEKTKFVMKFKIYRCM